MPAVNSSGRIAVMKDNKMDQILPAVVKAVLEASTDYIFIKNSSSVYIAASNSFARMADLDSADQVIGKTDFELFNDPEVVERFIRDDRDVLTTGKTLGPYIERIPSAEERPRYVSTIKAPLRNEAGEIIGLYGFTHEVTREYELKLNYDRQLRFLFELPPDALSVVLLDITAWRLIDMRRKQPENESIEPRCENIDDFFEILSRYSVEDAHAHDFLSSLTRERLFYYFKQGRHSFETEYFCRLNEKLSYWIKAEFSLMADPSNGHCVMLALFRDRTDQKRETEALRQQACQDSLTGLMNRGATMQQIEEYLKNEGQSQICALFIIDADNFKLVNDTFGHQAGDKVLTDIAEILKKMFRKTDITGRIGGDEFFVLMSDIRNMDDLRIKARELTEALQFECACPNAKQTINLSASMGISVCRHGSKSIEQLYAEADSALYRVKFTGKNNFEIADEDCLLPSSPGHNEEKLLNVINLRTILDNIEAAVFMATVEDLDVKLVYINKGTFSSEDGNARLIKRDGEYSLLKVEPEDTAELKKRIIKAASGEAAPEVEYNFRVLNKDNQNRWLHLKGTVLHGTQPPMLLGVVNDITREKRSEEELAFAELRYRTAMEQSSLLLCETDLRSNTLKFTGKASDRYRPEGRVFINPPESVLEAGMIDMEYADEYRRMYEDMRNGKDGASYTFAIKSLEGETRLVRQNFYLLRDEANSPYYSVGVIEPVIQNRELEIYRTLSTGGVFSVVPDEHISLVYANDRYYAIHGYDKNSMKEMLKNRCSLFIHPEDTARVKGYMREAAAAEAGTKFSWTERIITAKGKIKAISVNSEVAVLSTGMRLLNGVILDITEQKQTKTKLDAQSHVIDFALAETNVNYWFYDLITGDCCFTESARKIHGITDRVLHNFPRTLTEKGHIRADCVEPLLAAINSLEEKDAELEVWFRNEETGNWRCEKLRLTKLRETEGRVRMAIGVGTDITGLKKLEGRFEIFRKCRAISEKDNVYSSFRLNLTTNRCWDGTGNRIELLPLKEAETADKFFEILLHGIPSAEEKKACSAVFSREALLRRFAEGENKINIEYIFALNRERPVWLRTAVEMMENPATGDVEALACSFDIDDEKNTSLIINKLLSTDYELLGQVDCMTGAVKIYRNKEKESRLAGDGKLRNSYTELLPRLVKESVAEELRASAITQLSLHRIKRELKSRNSFSCVFPGRAKKSAHFVYKQWKFGYLDSSKRTIFFSRVDITKSYESERDPLTGLFNKNAFIANVRETLNSEPEKSFEIIRFDIDRFKAYNDIFGISAGDTLLRSAAKSKPLRIPDALFTAHIDADHFAVFAEAGHGTADKLYEGFRKWLENYSPIFKITTSFGVYRIDTPSDDIALMCDRALLALRTVKEKYDGKIAIYDDSMRQKLRDEQTMADEMEAALNREQFVIYFQPQVNYENGRLIGAEALVRWKHPTRGLIYPDTFIPLFEKNGFITRLDRYVWERSCRYMKEWREMLGKDIPISVSVNISRVDVYNEDICDTLCHLIKKYNLPPSSLHLEITESAYMQFPEQIIKVVTNLQKHGFCVEMDDFGSGYSSLNTLKDVPVDLLKLDVRFLTESDDNSRGGNILSSVIRMAHWLKLPVLAEGVETKAQAEYLNSLNCFYMQGYYFNRPMPAESFRELLKKAVVGKIYDYANVNLAGVAAFWDPSAQTALIFNSFVGGAAIADYKNGSVEIIRANDKFYLELETTRSESLQMSQNTLEQMQKPFRKSYEEMYREASLTGQEAVCEVQIERKKSAASPWIRFRVRLLAQNGNSFLCYLTAENITERKRTEARLLASLRESTADAERNRIVIDYMGILVFHYDYDNDVLSYQTDVKGYGYVKKTIRRYKAYFPQSRVVRDDYKEAYMRHLNEASKKPVQNTFEYVADLFGTGFRMCRGHYSSIADEKGHVYRLVGIVYDIQENLDRQSMLADLSERLQYTDTGAEADGAIAARIFTLLYESDNIARAINAILEAVGRYYGVSRTYIMEDDELNLTSTNTYEWCAEGVESGIDRLQKLKYSEYGNYHTHFDKNGIFHCPDTSVLPPEQRELLKEHKVTSLLQCAVMEEGRFIGFSGYDCCFGNRVWSPREIATLCLVSRIIGAFLIKQRRTEEAAFSEDFLRAIDSFANYTYIIDPATHRVLYKNKAIRKELDCETTGEICYRAYCGREAPCGDCPAAELGKRGHAILAEIKRADGRWFMVQASPLRWKDIEVAMLCCTDITKYKASTESD